MECQKPLSTCCFKPLAGMKLVYQPDHDDQENAKKHACPDCHFCQFCSEARCHSCHDKLNGPKTLKTQKLSICEQILLYERVNAQVGK